jgi:hypothetical protein
LIGAASMISVRYDRLDELTACITASWTVLLYRRACALLTSKRSLAVEISRKSRTTTRSPRRQWRGASVERRDRAPWRS